MEKFVVIDGFDNYAVSNYGRIKNIKNGRILNPVKNNHGYMSYVFCQNGVKKGFRIHRLVALYFIENPLNLPYVNHIDGDKTNNHVDNLEWCTAKENDTHARLTGLKSQNKPVQAINVDNGESIIFNSVGEASGFLKINKGTIHKVLSGKRSKTHGYEFKYI